MRIAGLKPPDNRNRSIHEQKQQAMEISNLLCGTIPGFRKGATKYTVCWPPNWFTKTVVLRACEYFHNNNYPTVPFKLILDGLFANPKILDKKCLQQDSTGKYSIKTNKRKSMVTLIKLWNSAECKVNFCTSPFGKRAPGAGKTADIPADIQIAAYSILCEMTDGETKIYHHTITHILSDLLQSAGYEVFLTTKDKQEYAQKQKLKLRLSGKQQQVLTIDEEEEKKETETPSEGAGEVHEDILKWVQSKGRPTTPRSTPPTNTNTTVPQKKTVTLQDVVSIRETAPLVVLNRPKVDRYIKKFDLKTFNSSYSTWYSPK